ncbi:MAG TPA: D-glycerate dehydrogenase [Candidatus Nanoarchaeia archaeon]|nr:D-glycerate dehydrogenase [Candidatus Nanoarchaeia archaeon]
MPKLRVFITRKIPESGIKLLQKSCHIKIYQKDQVMPKKELIKEVKQCDALLCLLTDKIDKEIIDANPKLKIISNYAIGFNNIDVAYATKKRIPVTNTPGRAIVDAVAEHTFALIFAVTKRIVEADRFMRAGKYKTWEPLLLLGMELVGKTIGIVGLGRIGSGVAQRAKAMGMKVVYYDVKRNVDFEGEFNAQYLSLNDLLKSADVVSVHVPLLPTTTHLIGKKKLSLMKKTAYLINTSRGPVIDEKALVQALKQKKIAGAGLDVYEFEPKLTTGLTKLQNVVLTPHIASATIEARSEMSKDAAENILAVLQGKKPKMLVNKEVYKAE